MTEPDPKTTPVHPWPHDYRQLNEEEARDAILFAGQLDVAVVGRQKEVAFLREQELGEERLRRAEVEINLLANFALVILRRRFHRHA